MIHIHLSGLIYKYNGQCKKYRWQLPNEIDDEDSLVSMVLVSLPPRVDLTG